MNAAGNEHWTLFIVIAYRNDNPPTGNKPQPAYHQMKKQERSTKKPENKSRKNSVTIVPKSLTAILANLERLFSNYKVHVDNNRHEIINNKSVASSAPKIDFQQQ